MDLLQTVVIGAQGNSMADGLATMVVGLGVVFTALLALIVILTLTGKFFDHLEAKQMAEKESQAPVVVGQTVEPATPVAPETDDLELIAVITASIAATMGTSADNLQVRSLRKTSNAWGMSGRTEQLYN